jgi:hypothetical protein
MASLIFFAASTRTRVVPADLVRLNQCGGFIGFIKLSYKVYISARWATKRKCRNAFVVRHREIAFSKDVHPYKGVDSSVQSDLGKAHHWKHHLVRKFNVDQMSGGCERASADANFLSADRRESKLGNDLGRD